MHNFVDTLTQPTSASINLYNANKSRQPVFSPATS